GPQGGHFGHRAEIRLRRGQAVPAEIVGDAGREVLLAEVDLVVFAGVRAVQVMHAADPVVVPGPLVVRELIPLDAAEDIHLALVLGLQLGDGGLVQRGAAGAHAVFPVAGGMAVPREAQRCQPLGAGGRSHLLQGIFAVAQRRVAVDAGSHEVCHSLAHCILSCLTLWSMICRFSSSRVMSSTVMPAWTISTRTW